MIPTIPGVRDALKQWAGGPRVKPDQVAGRETIAHRDVTILGSVARSTFAQTKDGRELRLRGPAMTYELRQAPDDAVLVTHPARDGNGRPMTEVFIGRVVEPGTYERIRRAATYTPKQRAPRPTDALADVRAGSLRQPVLVGRPEHKDPAKDVILGALGKAPSLLVTDGIPPASSVEQVVYRLNRAGARLRVHGGRLLADWSEISGHDTALLQAMHALIAAHVDGKPMSCGYEHSATDPPPAVTLDPGRVPVCAQHLAGEVGT